MDEGEIFNMYREVPCVEAKAAWALKYTKNLKTQVLKQELQRMIKLSYLI